MDTRSGQECIFLSFAANEASIIANQLEPWIQAITIEFLKNFKICIRTPETNRGVLSFHLLPMKPVAVYYSNPIGALKSVVNHRIS